MYSTRITFLLLSLFGLATLTAALGNLPGGCLANGTEIDPGVPHGSPYTSYCPSGYGRPQGVCNCNTGLNSCLQTLAGCPDYVEKGVFVPPIPPVLYVGTHYEFKINISWASLSSLCFLRPLPEGLSWVRTDPSSFQFAISGTPTESMPKADYGVAASRGINGRFLALFTFEIQSCSQADAVYPTFAPTSSPTTPSTTCTTAENGNMRCSGTNKYQTCDRGVWQPAQSCGADLVCSPQGAYIYCVRA